MYIQDSHFKKSQNKEIPLKIHLNQKKKTQIIFYNFFFWNY